MKFKSNTLGLQVRIAFRMSHLHVQNCISPWVGLGGRQCLESLGAAFNFPVWARITKLYHSTGSALYAFFLSVWLQDLPRLEDLFVNSFDDACTSGLPEDAGGLKRLRNDLV